MSLNDFDDLFPIAPQSIPEKTPELQASNSSNLFEIALDEFSRLQSLTNLTDWNLQLGKSIRTLGRTIYRKKVIEINHQLVTIERPNTKVQLLDTIRHEFAHAAVGSHVESHGLIWRRKAIELNAIPRPCANYQLVGKYKFTCGVCNKTFFRNRKPDSRLIYRHCGVESIWTRLPV